ncbi:hypothetical protein C4556_03055 [Candidatus Parcubacteria bacterium]|nr:MAG: hypothetical protein C4556_03055 [Candidatus Parcubacteria bacterium]
MKGIKRKAESKYAPTGEEWRRIEAGIAGGQFPNKQEQRHARDALRAISRYDTGSAWLHVGNLSTEGRAELNKILDTLGFELDIPNGK